jgi:hypothetical protein
MQKLKQILFGFLVSLIFLNPTLALAQTNTNTATSTTTTTPTYSGVDSSLTQYLCTPTDQPDPHALEKCINKVYRFGVAFGAIALVFFVVLAGYMYMAGGESGKTKAKGILQNALVGMAFLLGSYLLLSFINPNLVLFKPIQPPIFDAADIPTCDKVGLGLECVLPNGTSTVSDGKGGGQITPKCETALVAVKSKGIPVYESIAGANPVICPVLLDKLVQFDKAMKASKIVWGVTSTVSGTHLDICHKPNTAESGNCVDFDVPAASANHSLWEQTCKNLQSVGLNGIVNETGVGTDEIPACGGKQHYSTTSGDSLHINYLVGK